jgi:phosphate transport system ATP-binding protein
MTRVGEQHAITTATELAAEAAEQRRSEAEPTVARRIAEVAARIPSPDETDEESAIVLDSVSCYFYDRKVVGEVSMAARRRRVTALIGPSGCGKSTVLRTINRMHELSTGRPRLTGRVLLDGNDIYARGVDAVNVRRRIGMVFQKPNPFPAMSIYDNVVAGLKLNRFFTRRSRTDEVVERSLKQAALWDQVKDKLNQPGTALSSGQQQRLCIARALAVEPEVLLMDEPCSALDPIATLRIEELMRALVDKYTIVIVTHNMQQAARVSDYTAFMLADERRIGELIEFGPTQQIFTTPKDKRTEDYITGRFG